MSNTILLKFKIRKKKIFNNYIKMSASKEFVKKFLNFMDESCSSFHAVAATKKIFESAGFLRINESEDWKLVPGGKYYFTRNLSSMIAFTVGTNYMPGNGITAVGAHTDSPCLKLKAKTCCVKSNALMLNVQGYGGGLWHTWFDRDLGIAGRVIIKNEDGSLTSKLVRINKPIARIANVAIHLTTPTEREAFKVNLHEHARAILSMDASSLIVDPEDANDLIHPCLAKVLASEMGIHYKSIMDAELQLIDVQAPCLGGLNEDLLYSGRLDNLCSSYQTTCSLIDSDVNDSENIRIAFLFDHEEVGSNSTTGGGSSLFMDTLYRITSSLMEDQSQISNKGDVNNMLLRSLRKSYVVSIDMAHALHPNYTSKHDSDMAPVINGGLVIKHNANQRYATNALSATLFREFAKLEGLPMQEFSVRADTGCGSTIGPIIATLSGIMTVDVGSPQFSMHSIREMMGAQDVYTGYAHLKAAFKHHPRLMNQKHFEANNN